MRWTAKFTRLSWTYASIVGRIPVHTSRLHRVSSSSESSASGESWIGKSYIGIMDWNVVLIAQMYWLREWELGINVISWEQPIDDMKEGWYPWAVRLQMIVSVEWERMLPESSVWCILSTRCSKGAALFPGKRNIQRPYLQLCRTGLICLALYTK